MLSSLRLVVFSTALIGNACILGLSAQTRGRTELSVPDVRSDALARLSNYEDQDISWDVAGDRERGTDQPSCTDPTPFEVVSPAADAFPKVKLSGFFQADAGWIQQDALNLATVGDVQDGADFRRARLAGSGSIASNVSFLMDFDFAFSGRPTFMDVWLNVSDLPKLQNVKVGQYRQPIGLDGLTSVKGLTFIERGLPFAFLPFRQIGVMTFGTTANESATWALSGFRFPTDTFGGQIGDDGGYGMATRGTAVLIDGDQTGTWHLGAAYSVMDPSNDAVRYQSTPEFFMSETGGASFVPSGVPTSVPAFVDTGVLPTDLVQLFSSEIATTSGPFHAQAEAIFVRVNRPVGVTTTFSGASAQVGHILTREHRPYKRKQGVLGRIVPDNPFGAGGTGAWEVAAKWSWLNLNDADVAGGTLVTTTVGLNWYLNKFSKFQLNYIQAMLDSPTTGDSDASIVAARAQVDF